jgi:hypothetical protein
MFKYFLLIASVLALCQAMPSDMSFTREREVSMNFMNTTMPVARSWIESTNGSVVPLFAVRREIVRDWMRLSNETGAQLDEESVVKRVFNTMSEQERREFTEQSRMERMLNQSTRDFVEMNQDKREFEWSQQETTEKREFDWTNEVKRAWTQSFDGTIMPMKKREWMQFLNESVVVPVRRDLLNERASFKRELSLEAAALVSESESVIELSKRFVEQSPDFSQALNVVRNSRALSVQEMRSFNVSEFSRMCDGSITFKYYQAHPSNPSLFIQCDSWGQPIVRTCDEGLVWDQWRLTCCTPENVKNSTFAQGLDFDLLNAARALFDCNLQQYACLNGGVCTLNGTVYQCACQTNFTGDLCEVKIDSASIYSEILSGQFPFQQYKQRLSTERPSDEIKYFEQFRSSLSQPTYDELLKYLNSYKQGEVRYDRLVAGIIEDVLLDIYPDAFFLSVFNASSETVGNVVRMVPNLLSYVKYSNERYTQVFYQYQKTLAQLVGIFNTSWPTVEREATEYFKLAGLYLNNSLVLTNSTFFEQDRLNVTKVQGVVDGRWSDGIYDQSEGALSFGSRPAVAAHKVGLAGGSAPVQWTEGEVINRMRSEFNETMQDTNELFNFLERFRTKALVEIKRDPQVVSLPLYEARFDYSNETMVRLQEISRSNSEIWDSLLNYGFWYLTNVFSSQKF